MGSWFGHACRIDHRQRRPRSLDGDSEDIEEPLALVLAGNGTGREVLAQCKEALAEAEKADPESERDRLAYRSLTEASRARSARSATTMCSKIIERIEDREKAGLPAHQALRPGQRASALALSCSAAKSPKRPLPWPRSFWHAPPRRILAAADLVISAIVAPQQILDYEPHIGDDTSVSLPRDASSIPTEIQFGAPLHLDPALAKVAAEAAVRRHSDPNATGSTASNLPIAAFCWPGFTRRRARTARRSANSTRPVLEVIATGSKQAIEKAHALEKGIAAPGGAGKGTEK